MLWRWEGRFREGEIRLRKERMEDVVRKGKPKAKKKKNLIFGYVQLAVLLLQRDAGLVACRCPSRCLSLLAHKGTVVKKKRERQCVSQPAKYASGKQIGAALKE